MSTDPRFALKTPETHPTHETIGRDFVGHDKLNGSGAARYFCESYDPRIGFWMVRVDCPADHLADEFGPYRFNVSERAIGATFHRIYQDFMSGKLWEHARGWTIPPRIEGGVGEAVFKAYQEYNLGDIMRQEQEKTA